ncbi:MAG: hypothetical protein JXQ67_09620 [Campylobacterales bacterium]|nr:hypothetical protein [Campylobacterales bacterium]
MNQDNSQEQNLQIYIEKLHIIALERMQERGLSPIEALKEAINVIEGEMKGY